MLIIYLNNKIISKLLFDEELIICSNICARAIQTILNNILAYLYHSFKLLRFF